MCPECRCVSPLKAAIWPGNPALNKQTYCTQTAFQHLESFPYAWMAFFPCTLVNRFLLRGTATRLLRGFASHPITDRDISIKGTLCQQPRVGIASSDTFSHLLPNAKITASQQRRARDRAHGHHRLPTRQLALPHKPRKAMKVKSSDCLKTNSGKEYAIKDSNMKFNHTAS